tara:strand:+ start:14443 stop:15246 length:804 start_codon:yes stop_codon:yes gene_type:complete
MINEKFNLQFIFDKYDFLKDNTICKDDVFMIIIYELDHILSNKKKKFINDYLNSTSKENINFKSFKKLIRKLYVIDAFEIIPNINTTNVFRKFDRCYSQCDIYISPNSNNINNGNEILTNVCNRLNENDNKLNKHTSRINKSLSYTNTPKFYEIYEDLYRLNNSEATKSKNKKLFQSFKYKRLFDFIENCNKKYIDNIPILTLKRNKDFKKKIDTKNPKKEIINLTTNNYLRQIDNNKCKSLNELWKNLLNDISNDLENKALSKNIK